MTRSPHDELILDQFTRQALPFSTAKTIADQRARVRARRAHPGVRRARQLRDPSHVRAMPAAELRELFRAMGLPEPRETRYELRDELENLLSRSFPSPGDDERIRATFRASVGDDRLGIPVHLLGTELHYAYPVVMLCGDRV